MKTFLKELGVVVIVLAMLAGVALAVVVAFGIGAWAEQFSLVARFCGTAVIVIIMLLVIDVWKR